MQQREKIQTRLIDAAAKALIYSLRFGHAAGNSNGSGSNIPLVPIDSPSQPEQTMNIFIFSAIFVTSVCARYNSRLCNKWIIDSVRMDVYSIFVSVLGRPTGHSSSEANWTHLTLTHWLRFAACLWPKPKLMLTGVSSELAQRPTNDKNEEEKEEEVGKFLLRYFFTILVRAMHKRDIEDWKE